MSLRLRVVAPCGEGEVAGEVTLPTASSTFSMTPLGARQLGERLIALANGIDAVGDDGGAS